MRRQQRNIHMYRSLEDVASEMGITREGVRQIEQRALKKLRRALERQGISAADLPDKSAPTEFQ